MAEHPIFPDAIELAREWLLDHLDVPVVVAMTKQDEEVSKRHPEFVRLDLLGGRDQTRVSGSARVSFEAWGDTSPAAHDLAQETLALMRLLPANSDTVHSFTVDSLPANLPDPSSTQNRFTFQGQLHIRGTAYEPSGS